MSTLVISLSDAYIANTIKNAVARITGLVVMTENLLILANSFKSCKNLKELKRNFIHKNFKIYEVQKETSHY